MFNITRAVTQINPRRYIYRDENLSVELQIDGNFYYVGFICKAGTNGQQCKFVTPSYDKAALKEIALNILDQVKLQFLLFNKDFIIPNKYNYYSNFPIHFDIVLNNIYQYAYPQCDGSKGISYPFSNLINLCTLNEHVVKHEAMHIFIKNWLGKIPYFYALSEGCTEYFTQGICNTPSLGLAYQIRKQKNYPNITNILKKNIYNTTRDHTSYQLGPLACAFFHKALSPEKFLELLLPQPSQSTGYAQAIEQQYQHRFNSFIKHIDKFCREHPKGIYIKKNIAKLNPDLIHAIRSDNLGFFSGALSVGFSFDMQNGVILDRKLVLLIKTIIDNGCNFDLLTHLLNHKGNEIIDAKLNSTTTETVGQLLLSACKNQNKIAELLKLFEPQSTRSKRQTGNFNQDGVISSNNETRTVVSNSQQLIPFSLDYQLITPGLAGTLNGGSYFLSQALATNLNQHFPEKKVWVDNLTTYVMQPLASALINVTANSANRTSFIFDFASGCLSQTAVKCIQYTVMHYVGVGKISEAVNFIFFLHHFAMIYMSEDPIKAAIGQAVFSLASIASLTFLNCLVGKSIYQTKQGISSTENRQQSHGVFFKKSDPYQVVNIESSQCERSSSPR